MEHCSRCRLTARAPGQRYCAACHAEAQRRQRRKQRNLGETRRAIFVCDLEASLCRVEGRDHEAAEWAARGDALRWTISLPTTTAFRKKMAEGEPIDDPMCACGHPRSAHVYHEGPCRPGFVCGAACAAYRGPDDEPALQTEGTNR